MALRRFVELTGIPVAETVGASEFGTRYRYRGLVECDLATGAPSSRSWWDVPVAEVSTLSATRSARSTYELALSKQRDHLGPFNESRHEQ